MPTEMLLEAALEAFGARGYDATSVREIARDLGVSHNLIPQRVGSKDELWRAAVDHGFLQLAATMAAVFGDRPPEDDLDRLRALVSQFVAANAARPALLRIVSHEARTAGPRFDYLYEHFIDPVRLLGADLLARLRASGRVRSESVSLMYFFMMQGAGGPLVFPSLAERLGGSVDPRDPAAVQRHTDEMVAVLFDGLVERS